MPNTHTNAALGYAETLGVVLLVTFAAGLIALLMVPITVASIFDR